MADNLQAVVELWHLCRWHILLALIAVPITLKLFRDQRRRKRLVEDQNALVSQSKDGEDEAQYLSLGPAPSLDKARTVTSKPAPRRIAGRKPARRIPSPPTDTTIQPLVFFASIGGTTESIAKDVVKQLSSPSKPQILPPQLLDLAAIDYDDYFTTAVKSSDPGLRFIYILIIPTYNIDTILDTFVDNLKEVHHDFRIDTAPLNSLLGYAVFGLGDKEGWPSEEEGYCSQATEIDKWMARLTGSKRAYPIGMGDVKTDADTQLQAWRAGIGEVLGNLVDGGSLGEGVPGSGDPVESDEEDEPSDNEQAATRPTLKRKRKPQSTMTDLESLGLSMSSEQQATAPLAIDFTTSTRKPASAPIQPTPKPMVPVDSPTHTALTKQGYSIIGSHSGVKICRWTKSALRGRGSCYKHSFYGIASHLCMETTPSLSCSNKCVFCWRHGTNPVGTTWRWQVDPPDYLFEGVKREHYRKIKMMRGVPGVRAERFEEAMRIRHCALSLVGEPIFYPHINEFVDLLHSERISSFLVCNAQHPAQLAALKKVTQLYVSIDASNKDSLRKIDRPLHRDFWERFCACLDIIAAKRFQQRTVFRLTLVKGFNIEDEAEGYAELVQRGMPCFIEVKGVTYCGTSTSKGAGLSMSNVPFYEEVCAFVVALDRALARRGLDYGIAAEHAHSCCILLASERFRRGGEWCTRIDYGRFFELLEGGEEFRPEEYMQETEEWALWGKGGFDPRDERVKRKGKTGKDVQREVEPVTVTEIETAI